MKIRYLFFFLFLALIAQGQKESNWWYFGTRGCVDFNCNPPLAVNGIPHFFMEGNATISDSSGNFLFVTNGDSIWDRNLNPMPNGNGLAGRCVHLSGSGTQPALIIPQPGNPGIYYVFTTDCIEDTLLAGFRYSIVDMSLNNGNGDVILKNQLLFTPATEKITAIKNGNIYWIVTHEFGTNNFYAYSLSNTGISAPVISSTGQIHTYTPVSAIIHIPEQVARGYLKFSPDGSKLISVEMPDENPYITAAYVLDPEIFSFDANTGVIQSQFTIVHPDSIPYYSASFSPDGSKLYMVGAWGQPFMHQFNLAAGSDSAIVNSRTLINSDTSGYLYPTNALQLATNGYLYIATGYPWLDAIENPNGLGLACNYIHKAILLDTCPIVNYSSAGLPNFVESYFLNVTPSPPCVEYINADFIYSDSCFNNLTNFFNGSTSFPETINAWRWYFNDPTTGAQNFSYQQNPSHLFSAPGTYHVQLIAMIDSAEICNSDTIIRTVKIHSCTGLNEININEISVNIYPNPSDGNFKLDFPNLIQNGKIEIYDLLNQVIYKENISNTSNILINLPHVRPGIYFLKIEDLSNQYISKILFK